MKNIILIMIMIIVSGCINTDSPVSDTMLYETIAIDFVDTHTLERYVYSCYDFSEGLVNELEAAGFEAESISGYIHYNCVSSEGQAYMDMLQDAYALHVWVRLHTDTVSYTHLTLPTILLV